MGEPMIGKNTLPRLWILICRIWIVIAIGALIMVFTTLVMLMANDLRHFRRDIGTYLGNDVLRYPPGDPNNGYVNETNIPKHLGGAIFASVFYVSMMVFVIISICADLFWKFPIAKSILEMVFAIGLWTEAKMTDIEYFFLIANAFLKLFICAAVGAETYVGVRPDNDDVDTPLFCLYSVFILLGSIPLTVIASMFIIQHNKKDEYMSEIKAKESKK